MGKVEGRRREGVGWGRRLNIFEDKKECDSYIAIIYLLFKVNAYCDEAIFRKEIKRNADYPQIYDRFSFFC